ncbi:MAG: hypothetical protein JWP31_290 [Aeromicrobium sp.]|nr:hypothetical protein [Aeromicrobium sp.]
MKTWWRDNGLLIVNAGLFLVFFVGMVVTGAHAYSADQVEHGGAAVSVPSYLRTGDFVEATFENWESEFLQMGMYVVLTVFLFKRGSSESKPLDSHADQDDDPRDADLREDVPWPVRQGGLVLTLYQNSLANLLAILFAASIWLHASGGAAAYSQEQISHGGASVTAWDYVGTPNFWFESFQNWQSEFLVVALIVWASVYLRQQGSSQSKPVAAPHHETGA